MRSTSRYLPSFMLLALGVVAGAVALLQPERDQRERDFDEPLEAVRWMQIAQRDEFGNIAENGLMIARGQMDTMRALQRREQEQSGVRPIAGINRTGWTWIGPGNIGGRTR